MSDDICRRCGHDHSVRFREGDEVVQSSPGHSDHCDCPVSE